MRLKNILFVLITIVILATAGCGKKAITEDGFTSAVEGIGLSVNDDTETYSDTAGITKSLYGVKDDRSESYEFYRFKTPEDAGVQFDSLRIQIGDAEAEDKVEVNLSGKNYSLYKADVDGLYYHVCRIDNTLFFGSSVKDKKKEIEDFAKKIGYN